MSTSLYLVGSGFENVQFAVSRGTEEQRTRVKANGLRGLTDTSTGAETAGSDPAAWQRQPHRVRVASPVLVVDVQGGEVRQRTVGRRVGRRRLRRLRGRCWTDSFDGGVQGLEFLARWTLHVAVEEGSPGDVRRHAAGSRFRVPASRLSVAGWRGCGPGSGISRCRGRGRWRNGWPYDGLPLHRTRVAKRHDRAGEYRRWAGRRRERGAGEQSGVGRTAGVVNTR